MIGVAMCHCSDTAQEVVRDDGRVTALRGRLTPTKGAAETNLKLTWLADVSASALLLACIAAPTWARPNFPGRNVVVEVT